MIIDNYTENLNLLVVMELHRPQVSEILLLSTSSFKMYGQLSNKNSSQRIRIIKLDMLLIVKGNSFRCDKTPMIYHIIYAEDKCKTKKNYVRFVLEAKLLEKYSFWRLLETKLLEKYSKNDCLSKYLTTTHGCLKLKHGFASMLPFFVTFSNPTSKESA